MSKLDVCELSCRWVCKTNTYQTTQQEHRLNCAQIINENSKNCIISRALQHILDHLSITQDIVLTRSAVFRIHCVYNSNTFSLRHYLLMSMLLFD